MKRAAVTAAVESRPQASGACLFACKKQWAQQMQQARPVEQVEQAQRRVVTAGAGVVAQR